MNNIWFHVELALSSAAMKHKKIKNKDISSQTMTTWIGKSLSAQPELILASQFINSYSPITLRNPPIPNYLF